MLDKNPEKINKIFNEIALTYDYMNNVISFGLHNIVKRESIKLLSPPKYSYILDLCCGTGDFTKILTKLYPTVRVIGIDNSLEMLKLAKNKNPKSVFLKGDCCNLSFKDGEIDAITMGFGLRNIENRKKVLSEIYRVLKPNGKFLHLDFGKHNFFSKIFDIIVSILVKIYSVNDNNYRYLLESKNLYPEPEDLIEEFCTMGFELQRRKDFLFGIISVQIMVKTG